MLYTAKKFDIPKLNGLSNESIEDHLWLYNGYVNNFNTMTELLEKELSNPQGNSHIISEIYRRRSFEFGGMRLHEYYFSQIELGATQINDNSALAEAIKSQFGSVETMLSQLKTVGMMRGPGWAILYYDTISQQFLMGFTGEQHQGHFVTLPIIIALDVWEHAYIKDYGVSDKGKYIDAYFQNMNWDIIAKRFEALL